MTPKESWPARALMRRHAALWTVFGAFWALVIMRADLGRDGQIDGKAALLAVVSGLCFAGSLVCVSALASRPARGYRQLNRQGRQRVDAALAFGFPDDAQPFRRIERDLARALRPPSRAAVIAYVLVVLGVTAWLLLSPVAMPVWYVILTVVVCVLALLAIRLHYAPEPLALRAVVINTDDDE